MRVRFTADYDHVTPLLTVHYRAGMAKTVGADIGAAAVGAGKAREIKPRKTRDAGE